MIMIKSLMFSLLGFSASVINAEVFTIDSSDKCGKQYNISSTENADIHLQGGWNTTKPCVMSFAYDDTYEYYPCVKAVSLNLDCTTVIEFHKYFVAEYAYVYDLILKCDDINQKDYEEKCFRLMTKFYIVIKTETDTFKTHESAHIQVYRGVDETEGNFLGERSQKVPWNLLLFGIISLIAIAAVLPCCIYFRQKRWYAKLSKTSTIEESHPQPSASDPTSGSTHNKSHTGLYPTLTDI